MAIFLPKTLEDDPRIGGKEKQENNLIFLDGIVVFETMTKSLSFEDKKKRRRKERKRKKKRKFNLVWSVQIGSFSKVNSPFIF